ncbi:MAG: cytochrome c5 family protein [Alphaproteobacteria bacterium]|nr:c-type cytochrome [Alphaproteobacteria bacterium]MDE2112064.1 cytochrome c5 family protein [Alphaproteobacteria bacterium]MDE2492448.1 cytochrome c5 family protein [Alphaproteobacteria bacterium]
MRLSLCGYIVAGAFIVVGGALAADGQTVYTQDCAGCHQMMAPKTGDKAAWAPLIKTGTDAMTANVIKGKGMMPARGGHADLSDADIKAAVEYMESKSK